MNERAFVIPAPLVEVAERCLPTPLSRCGVCIRGFCARLRRASAHRTLRPSPRNCSVEYQSMKASLPIIIPTDGSCCHFFLADEFVNQHRFLKAALKAVNGIGDDGHGFRSALGRSQHRGEIFSLTA